MARLLFIRDNGITQNNTIAFYLLITFTVFFFIGCACMISLAILRKIKRSRQAKDLESAPTKSHRRSRHGSTISLIDEKAAFLSERSSTDSVPEIRLTFPEEQTDGKRQSRVVVVKISDKGSVGYAPYEEPLPVYKEKESSAFQDLDLERIGGLREKESKP